MVPILEGDGELPTLQEGVMKALYPTDSSPNATQPDRTSHVRSFALAEE